MGYQYQGSLTPWEIHQRVAPVLEARERAAARAQAERFSSARGHHVDLRTYPPPAGWPTPIPSDLPLDKPSHVICYDPGHHSKGTTIESLPSVQSGGVSGPLGGFLVGDYTPVPDWAIALMEEIQAAERAMNKEYHQRYLDDKAVRKRKHIEDAKELLSALGT